MRVQEFFLIIDDKIKQIWSNHQINGEENWVYEEKSVSLWRKMNKQ